MATQFAPQAISSLPGVGQLGAGAASFGLGNGALAHPGGLSGEGSLQAETGSLRISPACTRLPVGLAVAVPVRDFRVRSLLAMKPGEVIETQWGHGEDLPLAAGDVQLAWSEFEVVDTRLAVRVTRLA